MVIPHFQRPAEVVLRGHDQQLTGGDAAQGHVRAFIIVVPHPARLILYIVDRIEQLLRQPVITYGSIEALDRDVLLRLSGLNIFNLDSVFIYPGLHSTTDILWSVVAPNHSLHAAPANDLFQLPNQSPCQQ